LADEIKISHGQRQWVETQGGGRIGMPLADEIKISHIERKTNR